MLSSVRNQLVLLFSLITAAAIGFIYLYVVPQLQSSLTAEKLRRLQQEAVEPGQAFADVIDHGPSEGQLRRLALRLSQRAGSRVTVLGVREDATGVRPAFVIADSEVERTALAPSYPAATAALQTGAAASAVERIGGTRLGETALALSANGEPRWVVVLSESLEDVDDNVSLIKRQILIAGAIALAAALAAGFLAARAHSRRLRRLEAAAERVAEGDFSTPIPVDSTDEVGQLARTLNEMRLRLERLDAARKEFIANASHELRTPIFSLGGFVELLDEEDPDPEARAEFVRTMRDQIVRLTKLTTDLLDLSRLDAETPMRAEPTELTEIARAVAAEFAQRAGEREVAMRVVPPPGACWARGDPGAVARTIRILLDNALRFAPPGTEVTLTPAYHGTHATLEVADEGVGVLPGDAERIFERFQRGRQSGGEGGFGLGLAIGRELAERQGGRLELRSAPGTPARGARFRLSLPIEPEGGDVLG
jgi:signal transduction histidine kinase